MVGKCADTLRGEYRADVSMDGRGVGIASGWTACHGATDGDQRRGGNLVWHQPGERATGELIDNGGRQGDPGPPRGRSVSGALGGRTATAATTSTGSTGGTPVVSMCQSLTVTSCLGRHYESPLWSFLDAAPGGGAGGAASPGQVVCGRPPTPGPRSRRRWLSAGARAASSRSCRGRRPRWTGAMKVRSSSSSCRTSRSTAPAAAVTSATPTATASCRQRSRSPSDLS